MNIIDARRIDGGNLLAEAREIVQLFEDNPGAGTIGWRKGMLDRPHLSRAKQLLAQIDE